jgi:hypothetical protein
VGAVVVGGLLILGGCGDDTVDSGDGGLLATPEPRSVYVD